MQFFTLLTLSALASVGLAHPNHGAVAHAHAEHHVARAAGSTKHQKNNGTNEAATDHIPKFRPAQCVCPEPVCDPRLNKASVSLPLPPSPPTTPRFPARPSFFLPPA